jgi:hypothetical protein
MAGRTVAGELRHVDERAGVEFAVATHADDAELRELLRATPTPGGVSLCFEREPNYFAGENIGGARDTTILARRDGRVVCMGRCSRRTVYVGGHRREVGYLGELRLAPATPRGLAVLQGGYAFFARLEARHPADFYFTSVACANRRARRVLESGRMKLPEYQSLAGLVTFAWPVNRDNRRMSPDEVADRSELIEFLDTQARRYALATPWVWGGMDALRAYALGLGDFCVVRRGRRIVAAGCVWDQSAWRQTAVAGYAGSLGFFRPVINGLARWVGRPSLPAVGQRLRQACVHPLAVAAGVDGSVMSELWGKLEQCARLRGVEWLVASVAEQDGLRASLKGRRGSIEYGTRLYVVHLGGASDYRVDIGGQLVRPEAGLL